ncbi:MAG: hypothetical protein EA381_19490 [Planctomycetaceae bacterium]|nr:MAG: hypothetical protein EA381_19490 [Planctomycetaceae bacterium]
MIPIFVMTIETCRAGRRATAIRGGVVEGSFRTEPFSIFLHREDSEPVCVALRSRLAPTQPFLSPRTSRRRPTAVRAWRSGVELSRSDRVLPATIVAPRCDLASRSIRRPGGDPCQEQSGGRQAVGFRRTNGFDKNQRGVWEHLI